MQPRFLKLFLALIIFKFTEADIDAGCGWCPKVNQSFKCNEHFLIKKQWIWIPLAFLPSAIEAQSMSLFSFNFTNINQKRRLFNCNNRILNQVSTRAETLEVSIITENPLKHLGLIIAIYQRTGIPQLNKVPEECKRKRDLGIMYKYFVHYQEDEYLLIFGCRQINDTFHDRGFWLFDVNQQEADKHFILKKALIESNLTEFGFQNNKNVMFFGDAKDEGLKDGNYFYDHCYNSSQYQETILFMIVTIVGAAIFVFVCVKLICR